MSGPLFVANELTSSLSANSSVGVVDSDGSHQPARRSSVMDIPAHLISVVDDDAESAGGMTAKDMWVPQ